MSTITRSRVASRSSVVAAAATSAGDRRLVGTGLLRASRAKRNEATSAAACSEVRPERAASSSGLAFPNLEVLPKSLASRRAISRPSCPRRPLCKMSAMSSSAPSAATPLRARRSLGESKASLGCNGESVHAMARHMCNESAPTSKRPSGSLWLAVAASRRLAASRQIRRTPSAGLWLIEVPTRAVDAGRFAHRLLPGPPVRLERQLRHSAERPLGPHASGSYRPR